MSIGYVKLPLAEVLFGRRRLGSRHAWSQPFEVRLPYDYAIHVCLGGLARRDARGMFSNDGVDLIDECELRVRSETKPQVDVLGAHERFIEPGPFGSEQLAVDHHRGCVDDDVREQIRVKVRAAAKDISIHRLQILSRDIDKGSRRQRSRGCERAGVFIPSLNVREDEEASRDA